MAPNEEPAAGLGGVKTPEDWLIPSWAPGAVWPMALRSPADMLLAGGMPPPAAGAEEVVRDDTAHLRNQEEKEKNTSS